MPRRNRIPIEHRERIVRAFEDEAEDYLLVAYIHRLYLNSNYQSSSVELTSSKTKKYINQLNY